MAKENKEVIEEVTEEQVEQPKEEVVEQKLDESKFESAGDDSIIKVDLSNPPVQESEEVEKQPTEEEKVDVVEEKEVVEEVVENESVLQEVTEEVKDTVEEVQDVIEEAVAEAEATGKPLPENIQRLVDFMDETGGDIQDYVNLNRDVSKMDDSDVLDEYYRTTKSHLTAEERSFLLEEKFGVDEDVDDDRTIRAKKIALKEQVAEAKAYLDGQKSKYYEDIKAGSKLTQEQQQAIDFFNRYNKESEEQKKLSEASIKSFRQKTNNVFNKDFKGFDFSVGDKKYRFNVKDVDKVKTTQSDINNFINKFINEGESTISDAKGYHKSLFTAMNADAVAKHFYEQGRADATKARVAKDKNINLEPRKSHGEFEAGGIKVKVLGDNASDLKNRSFKIRKKN
tara:strand:- start:929 stop:2119 length:1191 start_codon:yes stop_codon:yes gene_type:complete